MSSVRYMSKEVAYGVVQTLGAMDFLGEVYINGTMVTRQVNEKGACWVVFRTIAPDGECFQYTPGGTWEELQYLDGTLAVVS